MQQEFSSTIDIIKQIPRRFIKVIILRVTHKYIVLQESEPSFNKYLKLPFIIYIYIIELLFRTQSDTFYKRDV